MEDFLKKVIFDLLSYGKTQLIETKIFKELKHNKDLVPAFNQKLNEIIRHFDRYHKTSYDIQGIRDNGIDVLVKYEAEYENKIIGIQIKSYDDLEVAEWTSKLKSQIFDAISHYGSNNLVDFYIAFCTDAIKHKDKIRNATADIVGMTKINIHILNPEESLYFMHLAEYEIGAYLKKKLSDDDPVLIDARESLSRLTLAQSAMVIEAASLFIEYGKREIEDKSITESSFVAEIYDKYPNVPEQTYESNDKQIKKLFRKEFVIDEIADFQFLCERSYFDMSTYTTNIEFNHESHIALISVMYEAMARFNYSDYETKWYAFELLKDFEIEIAHKIKNCKIN